MASSAVLKSASFLPASTIASRDTTHYLDSRPGISIRALPFTKRFILGSISGSALSPVTSNATKIRPFLQAKRPSCVCARVTNRSESKTETIVPDPDYRLAISLLGISAALVYMDKLLPAAPIGLLGLLLLVQTTRVKFVFDSEALEVKVGSDLHESGENVFVGGKNRWKYSTFVNWELWWPNFPVLVYFKETQTKPEGQVHFFPVIFNGKQLYDVLVARAGPSKNSGPK